MKKLFLIAGLLVAVLVVGCSSDSPVAPTSTNTLDGSQFQRPEFIDTRPQAEQIANTLTRDDAFHLAPVSLDKSGGKYALVIGISDYDGDANDLQYCDDDAVDWRNYLVSQGYDVTTLLDGAADRAAIEAAVADLAALSIAGNEIVFSYSGHGSRGNLISSDLTYVSDEWLASMFDGVGSTMMSFNIDACQIGIFGETLAADGRVIALASDEHHFSYDGTPDMANGVFTYFQMLGFDDEGLTTAEEDDAFAVQEMLAWGKTYHVKVTPSYEDFYTGLLAY